MTMTTSAGMLDGDIYEIEIVVKKCFPKIYGTVIYENIQSRQKERRSSACENNC